MNLIYFAHSYRKPDAGIVEFFGQLMRSESLTPSLDPPSDHLNSAKPERHLSATDAMIAVLTAREGGVSQYILYEISLCLRAKKPLLVFVEDTLPDGLVPSRILQRRFSRKGYLRQIREHRHAIRILKTYLGDERPPNYQPSLQKRSCVIVGTSELESQVREEVISQVAELGYAVSVSDIGKPNLFFDQELQETLTCADLAICLVDSSQHSSRFFFGAIRASLTPAILFTSNLSYDFHPRIPREYQPRIVSPFQITSLRETIKSEILVFEEDYVDLDNQEEVTHYADLLIKEASPRGSYSEDVRRIFVKELVMGDQYSSYGQTGAMGPHATGTINVYSQAWQQISHQIDLPVLASELSVLRTKLRENAETPEQDKAVAAVADAEIEAKQGNGPKALEHLAKAGKWVLDVAKEIGVKVAVEALKQSLGLPA